LLAWRQLRFFLLTALLVWAPGGALAQTSVTEIVVPRVDRPPVLEDFLDMKSAPDWEGKLARVTEFIQFTPSNGASATQRTDVYLCYDHVNIYVIFVAFDSEPKRLRARLARRETVQTDDVVEVLFDTFMDGQRGYVFAANPYGVQIDSLWTEVGEYDDSFDTLWYSRGRLTSQGFVVWMAVPFRSLRFPTRPEQTWGVQFVRFIPRNNEDDTWPHRSSRIQGRLNQVATLRGLEGISPGRNFQLIPYGALRSFRALDLRDPLAPRFVSESAQVDVGLDAKFVFRDSLVLDVALNPDFSQVESDEPQITLNQRFEVLFPEKRPFFLENANFFQTPINLLFTRRIADPQFGARLTGKLGRFNIGGLLIDDQSPGKRVPDNNPLAGRRAGFGVFRLSRDFPHQSSLGVMFTERRLQGSLNRVVGLDGRWKLNPNWVASGQAVTSWTRSLDGSETAGPAYQLRIERVGRQFNHFLEYQDRSPGFRTMSGFDPRPDIRAVHYRGSFDVRPEGVVVSWGPRFWLDQVWDHTGTRLDSIANPWFNVELKGQTIISAGYTNTRERLRPQDFPGLPNNIDLSHADWGVTLRSNFLSQLNISANYFRGNAINFTPIATQLPDLARWTNARFTVTIRPVARLRIDNTYLLNRITDRSTEASIFNDHVIRSKWTWQFTRELSLRTILQYNATIANRGLSSADPRKNFNADMLITYLVNPWTALYVGYNSNLQNIDPALTITPSGPLRTRARFLDDSRQFFVKFSYLFRF